MNSRRVMLVTSALGLVLVCGAIGAQERAEGTRTDIGDKTRPPAKRPWCDSHPNGGIVIWGSGDGTGPNDYACFSHQGDVGGTCYGAGGGAWSEPLPDYCF